MDATKKHPKNLGCFLQLVESDSMFEQILFIYLYRSNKHNGQSKSQPTLITQTRSLESSESSSKPTEDASEILKEITAKTEEISLTK